MKLGTNGGSQHPIIVANRSNIKVYKTFIAVVNIFKYMGLFIMHNPKLLKNKYRFY